MTKKEMKALVASKIASQGNQVDVSGALGTILNAIVDAIPEAEPSFIDLGNVPLPSYGEEGVDVSEFFPINFKLNPLIGLIHNGDEYYFMGAKRNEYGVWHAIYGYNVDYGDYCDMILLDRDIEGKITATILMV